jgi:cytochrome c oxidase assembly protein subunit 15
MDFFANKFEIKAAAEKLASAGPSVLQRVVRLRQFAIASMTIVGITVFSGAFVAGNLAGLMYSDWPLMAGKFVPDGIAEQWDEFNPRFRNVFENIALVQFDHRMLAYTTLGVISMLWFTARGLRGHLSSKTMLRVNLMLGAVWTQASLGVATILAGVPVELGVVHQAGALTTWTLSIWLLHHLRYVRLALRV